MLKAALCSFGMSGRVFHAPVITDCSAIELSVILERTKNESLERYPNAKIVRSFDDIIEDSTIDLVIVNTPNQLHYPMAKAAIEAGKHVVIEKPITITVTEGHTLTNLAKEKNVVLSVFHNKRFEGDYLYVKELLENNILGDIQSAEFRFDRYRPEIGPKKWKENNLPGAGILYDLGPHLIDQALTLFGKPNTINHQLRVEREKGQVTDAFDLDFKYDDFTVRLGASMLVETLGPKIKIEGTKGSFIKYGADPQEAQLINGLSPKASNYGIDNENQRAELTIDGSTNEINLPKGSYLDFYNNVADVILNNALPLVEPEEALKVMRIIEGCYKNTK